MNASYPMNILGYGSLLHVESLQRTLPKHLESDLEPVRVDGWQRVFRFVSTRRAGARGQIRSGARVGVLDVEPVPGAAMGAVRFALRDEAQRLALDRREAPYQRIRDVTCRGFYGGGETWRAVIYQVANAETQRRRLGDTTYQEQIAPLGIDGLLAPHILPFDDYLQLCLTGAYRWGRAFGDDFVATTRLADGRGLWQYGPACQMVRVARAHATTIL